MNTPTAAIKRYLKAIRIPILGSAIRRYFAWRRYQTELRKYRRWAANGRIAPPPALHKQMVVRSTAKDLGLRVLIETGTFEGQMVEAVARDFETIYTIELDPSLHAQAARQFVDRAHIHTLQGDSGQILPALLHDIDEPVLFWLDAHYSGGATAIGSSETPIMSELAAIAAHPRHAEHVLLIDDARAFTGGAYPSRDELHRWSLAHGFDVFEIADDIIRIQRTRANTPRASAPLPEGH